MSARLASGVLLAAVFAHGAAVKPDGVASKAADSPLWVRMAIEGKQQLQHDMEPQGRGPSPWKQTPVIGAAFNLKNRGEFHPSSEFTPVSTTTKCVINLTLQYVLVYTALAICRSLADTFGMEYKKLPAEKILRSACLTVNYAPMLAVLFLCYRLRVLWLSQGHVNPPEWIQKCMYCCTYAVLMMTLTACVIPLFTGEAINVDPRTGNIREGEQPFEVRRAAWCFTLLKFVIMFLLYAGVLAIMYGIVTYEPPKGSWPGGDEKIPPVGTFGRCTTILAVQYFIVYALVQVARSFTQLSGYKTTKFENAALTAADSVNLAPMLGILFVAARIRALQMDPIYGHPQAWSGWWFYFCTFALTAQTLLCFIVPLVLQGEVRPGTSAGDMEYGVRCYAIGLILIMFRFLIMLSLYVGLTLVIVSIFTLESPRGPQYTPPISLMMQCVINLTTQFFFVYLLIWIGHSIHELTGYEPKLLTQTMDTTKATVQMCPMLAILFACCRMRALQITKSRGAPQGWVQDAMYVATWSVFIQSVMCLLTPYFTGQPLKLKRNGHVDWKPQRPFGFAMVQCTRWVAFLFMYGGIIMVIVGIFMMTPETANGHGAVPLIADGEAQSIEVGVLGL